MYTTISSVLGKIITFLSALFFFSALIGLLFALINLPWGWFSIILSVGTSSFLTMKFSIELNLERLKDLIAFSVMLLILCVIYFDYATILELRQDPSLYLYRSFKLIDAGYVYQNMPALKQLIDNGILKNTYEGYATIQNGITYQDGILHLDFYPGGSYFYAFWGKFHKSLTFYSQGLISIISACFLFLILKKITKESIVSATLTLSMFVSPAFTWFGKGSFSEPSALLCFITAVYLLSNKKQLDSAWGSVFTMTVILTSYLVRYEYLVFIIIGSSLYYFIDIKKAIILSVLSVIILIATQKVFWIYAGRLGNANFLFKYDVYILILAVVLSAALSQLKIFNLKAVYSSKYFTYALMAFPVVSLLVYRENFTEEFQMKFMHGALQRTYNEIIFERLFFIIPSIVIIIGFFLIWNFKNNRDIHYISWLFMLGMFSAYLTAFWDSKNSPQLYWNIRRYLYVLIPFLFIAASQLVNFFSSTKIKYIYSLVILLLTVNLNLNSQQIADYKGLDNGIEQVSNSIPENALVVYDMADRYAVSSLINYKSLDFIPVYSLSDVVQICTQQEYSERDIVLVSTKEHNGMLVSSTEIQYLKQGEEYGFLPVKNYKKGFLMNIYDAKSLDFNKLMKNNVIYPNAICCKAIHGYSDNWTVNGKTTIKFQNCFEIEKNRILSVERMGYRNPLIDENLLFPRASINGINLTLKSITRNSIDFIIDNSIAFSYENTLIIESNYFVPKERGINGDSRKLGIDLKSIQVIQNQ